MNEHQSALLRIINQAFEMEKKMQKQEALQPLQRNLERMLLAIEEMGYRLHNPAGEQYDEQRTDYEVNISGDANNKLYITEVLKPAVYLIEQNKPFLVQKAVVIADNRKA